MNDKYLIFICIILIGILFYKLSRVNEHMTDLNITTNDQIKNAVKQLYLADVEAIRNLSEIATQLQKNGLTIPGNLTVSGNVVVSGSSKLNGQTQIADQLTVGGSFNIIPKGIIVNWSGSILPPGWTLCDGTNGTPNLSGKFVLGMGSNKILGTTGGEENVVLNVNQIPKHAHPVHIGYHSEADDFDNSRCSTNSVFNEDGSLTTTGAKWGYRNQFGTGVSDWDNSICTKPAGTGPIGGNLAHNNMPPYYVLAYIMKL
jgi:microcystin-dependent protein